MRLDKFLSESSPFSRRELRSIIRGKRVCVNDKCITVPDFQVSENSAVSVDGKLYPYRKFIYLMLNKPAGYLSATEDDRDPVVTDLVPEELRHFDVFPAGRLDKDTEGLLLLSNDGDFCHRLMSPRKSVFKRYFARLDAPATEDDVKLFASGMDLGDFTAAPGRLFLTENPCEVYVEIAEGKFHQVKRMCANAGKNVLFLKRVAIGALQLDPALQPGDIRELTESELTLFD